MTLIKNNLVNNYFILYKNKCKIICKNYMCKIKLIYYTYIHIYYCNMVILITSKSIMDIYSWLISNKQTTN